MPGANEKYSLTLIWHSFVAGLPVILERQHFVHATRVHPVGTRPAPPHRHGTGPKPKTVPIGRQVSGTRGPLAPTLSRLTSVLDRYIEVVDDRLTGEVLLDEALKMMKVSERMSVGTWIDLMSGEAIDEPLMDPFPSG